jgi:hypothetical protein
MVVLVWAGCIPHFPVVSPPTPPDGLVPRAVLWGRWRAAHEQGVDGLGLAAEVIGDTDGDGLPELYVAQSGSGGDLLLPRPLQGGLAEEQAAAWLPPGHSPAQIAYAGDTDGDGYGDLWLGQRLFRGPLSGKYDWTDADAILETYLGRSVVGDFDADGDGWPDMAMGGPRQDLVVQYGPFEGHRVDYDRSDEGLLSQITVTEAGEDCGEGELQHVDEAVLVAGSATMPLCAGSRWVYDLAGPRGRRLSFQDAKLRLRASDLEVLPDADGDGKTDLLYLGQPVTGPWPDELPASTDHAFPAALSVTDSAQVHATGDVTGDGLGDLLIQHHAPSEPAPSWYVVAGTTRGLGLDVRAHGVQLGTPSRDSNTQAPPFYAPRWTWGDLDMDGLAELIASQRNDEQYPGPSGWVWIFNGADIARAYRARVQGEP